MKVFHLLSVLFLPCFFASSSFRGGEKKRKGRKLLKRGQITRRELSKPIIDEEHAWVSPHELMVSGESDKICFSSVIDAIMFSVIM